MKRSYIKSVILPFLFLPLASGAYAQDFPIFVTDFTNVLQKSKLSQKDYNQFIELTNSYFIPASYGVSIAKKDKVSYKNNEIMPKMESDASFIFNGSNGKAAFISFLQEIKNLPPSEKYFEKSYTDAGSVFVMNYYMLSSGIINIQMDIVSPPGLKGLVTKLINQETPDLEQEAGERTYIYQFSNINGGYKMVSANAYSSSDKRICASC
ncbi:hypothetical protein H5A44_19730 [Pectobacterium brasiliense]|uniref:hypothetical protein n=1 Tax=Pectobacterium TaxID=122277 RepID=UPI00027E0919|nr:MULTISPECIES: hypothetical protein [Pectobacterium]GKV99326.1 hypothetical protein PEC301653_23720 [Pectobacterium carotovorum subsp. carotovorum]AFR04306.1 hypothetical protein PCC21_029030 [Pectobacterium carotovorum subsp. carotovorum PCC21]KHS73903.1 hypothetical protein QT13_04720 [Pectobacterium brasiliense]KHS87713.1 hypothetical protein RC83_10215 [Pectobacterium brasiliense]MBN3208895.1 hypothetical protein [Pectobacterium brasiliense]